MQKIFLNPPTSRSLIEIEKLYLTHKHIITGAIKHAGMTIEEACACVVGGIALEYRDTYSTSLFDSEAHAVEYFVNRYREDIRRDMI